MTAEQITSLISLVVAVIVFLGYTFFLFPRQLINTYKFERDGLTRLRHYILFGIAFTALLSLPSILYQYSKVIQMPSPVLANLTSLSTNLGKLATFILLVVILTYTYRIDKK